MSLGLCVSHKLMYRLEQYQSGNGGSGEERGGHLQACELVFAMLSNADPTAWPAVFEGEWERRWWPDCGKTDVQPEQRSFSRYKTIPAYSKRIPKEKAEADEDV